MDNQSAGWRGKLAGFALAFAIFVVLWFIVAALGSKLGLWSWGFGLGKMTIGWGPMLAMGALGLSVIALIISLIKSPRKRPFILSAAALLIAGLTMGRLAAFGGQAERLPPLHDIQTNWSAPITPSAELLAVREADGDVNPILDAPTVIEGANGRWPGTGGQLVSELQEAAEFDPDQQDNAVDAPYPKIDTLDLNVPPQDAYSYTKAAMESMGLEIVTDNPAGWQLEGTATTGWYGFKDDVMVRITPSADMDAALIDVRSTSRVGLSDLGANAKRIRNLLDEIEMRAKKGRTS